MTEKSCPPRLRRPMKKRGLPLPFLSRTKTSKIKRMTKGRKFLTKIVPVTLLATFWKTEFFFSFTFPSSVVYVHGMIASLFLQIRDS